MQLDLTACKSIASSVEPWFWAIAMLAMVAACYLGPIVFTLPAPTLTDFSDVLAGIGAPGHPLGTDALGRDLLSRCLHGGRISLTVSFGAVFIGMLMGSIIGIIAGFNGGLIDAVISRCLDIMFAFPGLILALMVASYLGPSLRNLILAIAFFTVPAYARMARSGALRIRGQDFITAARLFGATGWHIGARHVLPNVFFMLLTYSFVLIGIAMIIEAGLSFLGLGVPPPSPSWGQLVAMGKQDLAGAPHVVVIPGLFLFVTILGFNRLGDILQTKLS